MPSKCACIVVHGCHGADIPTCQQDVLCLSMSAEYAEVQQRQYDHAVVMLIPRSARRAKIDPKAGHRR
jgi:hypothetical protein